MYPTQGDLHVAPFTDEALYMEQFTKANFWYQESFHGINLTSLRDAAVKEYFKQPIVVSAYVEVMSVFIWKAGFDAEPVVLYTDRDTVWNVACIAAVFQFHAGDYNTDSR